MKGIIRIGDKTTGGGTVLSGCTAVQFGGIGVARQGDPLKSQIPGYSRLVITEGLSVFKDNGVPIAFHGSCCACGCTLISSLPVADAS